MALNFNLLQREGPQGLYEGFVQGQAQQQANALTQQANQLAQQKMAQESEINALRVQQMRGTIGEQESTRKKQAQTEKVSAFRERLLRAPTPEAAREIVKMQYADPDLGPILAQSGTLEQSLAEVADDPAQFERYKQQEALGMSEWMKSQMPKVTPTGDVYDPAKREFIRKPQAIPAPVAPTAPVAVMGPDGKPRYVSREESFGMTPFTPATVKFMAPPPAPAAARQTETAAIGLTPKELQKREAVLPQARQAVNTVSNTMSVIGETVDRLLTNKKGLNDITGLVGGRIFGITDEARQAEADINQLKNLAFIQGITELRAASKTGAGVGNVSNKEGDRFENLKASLDRKQSTLDMIDALRRLKSQSEFTKQSLKEAFDETYAYREQQTPSAKSSDAAQERANANAAIAAGAPAAAVRARFKEKTGQEL